MCCFWCSRSSMLPVGWMRSKLFCPVLTIHRNLIQGFLEIFFREVDPHTFHKGGELMQYHLVTFNLVNGLDGVFQHCKYDMAIVDQDQLHFHLNLYLETKLKDQCLGIHTPDSVKPIDPLRLSSFRPTAGMCNTVVGDSYTCTTLPPLLFLLLQLLVSRNTISSIRKSGAGPLTIFPYLHNLHLLPSDTLVLI